MTLADGTLLSFVLRPAGSADRFSGHGRGAVHRNAAPESVDRSSSRSRSSCRASTSSSPTPTHAAVAHVANLVLTQEPGTAAAHTFEAHRVHSRDKQSRLFVEATNLSALLEVLSAALGEYRDPSRVWVFDRAEVHLQNGSEDVQRSGRSRRVGHQESSASKRRRSSSLSSIPRRRAMGRPCKCRCSRRAALDTSPWRSSHERPLDVRLDVASRGALGGRVQRSRAAGRHQDRLLRGAPSRPPAPTESRRAPASAMRLRALYEVAAVPRSMRSSSRTAHSPISLPAERRWNEERGDGEVGA